MKLEFASRISALGGAGSNARVIADQTIVSAANFGTAVLVARMSSSEDFGRFTVSYLVLVFAINLQTAVVTQPHNVLGVSYQGEDYNRYTTATSISHFGLLTIESLLLFIAAVFALRRGDAIAPLLFITVPTLIFWQLQELVRRIMFTCSDVVGALKNDLVAYGGQLAAIGALSRMEQLTTWSAMAAICVSSGVGAALGAWQIRQHFTRELTRTIVGTTVQENWRFGRWLLGTSLLSSGSEYLYPMAVAALVGLNAAGFLRATQTLVGPTQILLFGMVSYMTPHASRAFQDGQVPVLRSLIKSLYLMTAPIMACYCLIAAVFSEPLLRLMYGSEYSNYSWLLVILAGNAFLYHARLVASIGLRAMGRTDSLFHATAWLTLAVLIIGIPAMIRFGLGGAAVSLLIGSFLGTVVHWAYYQQAVRALEDAALDESSSLNELKTRRPEI